MRIVKESRKNLYAPVFYITGTYEWLPIDKIQFIRQLSLISNADKVEYPCYFEIESDGEMFIHPRMVNPESDKKDDGACPCGEDH